MKQTPEHIQKRLISRKGYKHSEKTKEKIGKANAVSRLGLKHSEVTKKRIGLSLRGDKHWMWKGDEVGMTALHLWVVRRLGKPDTCEHCGKSGLKGAQIHWANKSHEYKRELSDWLRLCVSCHRHYDCSNLNRKRGKDGKFVKLNACRGSAV